MLQLNKWQLTSFEHASYKAVIRRCSGVGTNFGLGGQRHIVNYIMLPRPHSLEGGVLTYAANESQGIVEQLGS